MTRLLVANDHVIFRDGLRRLLSEQIDFEVVAEAGHSDEVMDALATHAIDVAIVDLALPGSAGVRLIGMIGARRPRVRVLVLSRQGDDPHVTEALRAGACGYLSRESAADDLVVAVRRLADGGRYLCPSIAERLTIELAGSGGGPSHRRLSSREYRIFELLIAGKRGSQIAHELALSEKTVSTHKAHVLKKLNVASSAELVMYAVRHQLMPL